MIKSIRISIALLLVTALLLTGDVLRLKVYASDQLTVTYGNEFHLYKNNYGGTVSCPSINKIDGMYYMSMLSTPLYDQYPEYSMHYSTNLNGWPKLHNWDMGGRLIKLQNGSLFTLNVDTLYHTPTGFRAESFLKPAGGNFEKRIGSGTLPSPQTNRVGSYYGSFKFAKTVLQMSDGSLQAPAYGYYENDSFRRTIWMKSTNGGVSWNYVSTIAYLTTVIPPSSLIDFGNAAVVKCQNGSLLCVMATNVMSYSAISQSRSTDGGLTWSVPVAIAEDNVGGAEADLYLMSNGVLALSFGKANQYNGIMFSPDGNGDSWETPVMFEASSTSGYTSLVESTPGTLLMVSDKTNEIVGRYITVSKNN